MAKKALITGIIGQDGSYLAEFFCSQKDMRFMEIVRRSSSVQRPRLDAVLANPQTPRDRLLLHYGDLSDGGNLVRLVGQVQPDEVYNLAAQSHVRVSFDTPELHCRCYRDRLYPAAGGEFAISESDRAFTTGIIQRDVGKVRETPQTELTPFHPRSPYAVAKVFA
jgi:GDPmannose 4,6-dehydratase